jgi:hypothetical protein
MQILFCALVLPRLSTRRLSLLDRWMGLALHGVAYICALIRLPFAIGPFLSKRVFFLLSPIQAGRLWQHPIVQALRVVSEVLNLLFITFALQTSLSRSGSAPAMLLGLIVGAELLRLAAQKGQMCASASWQLLPHRALAQFIAKYAPWLARCGYCRYYARDDAVRLHYLRSAIRRMVSLHPVAARRLAYLHAFRIVPDSHYLRSGHVRDIARGEVFIHRRWANDPWLLIGLAFRRAPWMFDPRELPRPFAYRTAANRIMTNFVLCHTRFIPTIAGYQFGHEIKAASHDLVLRALWLIGLECEAALRADGTFPFERDSAERHGDVLWIDDAALCDIRRRHAAGEQLTVCEIAEQYTYPRCYVVDVLVPQLRRAPYTQADENAASIALAVTSGASQCG